MKHHAFLYLSESALPSTLHRSMIDTVELRVPQVGIDDARRLQDLAYVKSFAPETERNIIVITETIRYEAQNALLKLLEEPPQNTVFHVVVTDQSGLLPTLRSRFSIVTEVVEDNALQTFEAFMRLSYKARLECIVEQLSDKSSHWPALLLKGFGEALHKKSVAAGLYPVYTLLCAHLNGPGASNKMLLEHLALSLPELN